ncbi:hypothetical protein VF21_07381 [Pseudogymnoascus sp. 05NY08]|nr:hypothetical protein VF21_07381 [Pseudogymnoascus sp. 05NY08]
MTKTIKLLEIAKGWLDEYLGNVQDDATFHDLQRKVETTLLYEKSCIAQVLLNINDHQSEVQMDLMVLQLEENRHAIQQAVSVGSLTRLAFFFVPLSTICSAFGMNLREMDNHPSIWWFVGASVICTLAATAISSNAIRRLVDRTIGGATTNGVRR